jgi:O-antigen ligase
VVHQNSEATNRYGQADGLRAFKQARWKGATIREKNLRLRLARLPLWVCGLALVLAYITLVTDDAYVARIPLKLFMVAGVIAVWWWQVGKARSLDDYDFALPVLLVALAVPAIWSAISALHSYLGDDAGLHNFSWTAQEASRFVYLLLYFPLIDSRRLLGGAAASLWLGAILLLCFATVAIFFAHYLTGSPVNQQSFLFFKGVFSEETGGFRVFIGNQILFVVAGAYLTADLAAYGASRLRWGALALLLAGFYTAHTRGLWLAISAVCAGVLLVLFWREMQPRWQRHLLGGIWGLAVVAVLVGVAILSGLVARPSFLDDTSAGSRVQQAPKLWNAYRANPILGDGLGAVIKPHFVRDPAAPWSYELTYFQILFQMGVVGLIALLVLPLRACWVGLKRCAAAVLQPAPLAGVMAILGILIASATNPYLMSSFGMLGVAIGLSLIGRPSVTSSASGQRYRLHPEPAAVD